MKPVPTESAASRLCAACGMCCNGVLFSSVRIQGADNQRRLAILGLRAKKRGDGLHIPQPCPAHCGSMCAIYNERPERCRMFKCRQIQLLEDGERTEAGAMDAIIEAANLVSRVSELLDQGGDRRTHKSLAVRCESVLTPPLDPSPAAGSVREKLRIAANELAGFLDRHFRANPAQNAQDFPKRYRPHTKDGKEAKAGEI